MTTRSMSKSDDRVDYRPALCRNEKKKVAGFIAELIRIPLVNTLHISRHIDALPSSGALD